MLASRAAALLRAGIMPVDTLLEGYQRFRHGPYRAQRARWDALALGQSPPVMVIGCADSRVDPGAIFDAAPGELFVIRNVAGLVPPYERGGGQHGVSSAVEFAVLGLNVRHIVVLGHAACGGIRAALDGHTLLPEGESFLTRWMSILAPARDAVERAAALAPGLDRAAALELAAIRVSLGNLRGFPFVGTRVDMGELTLHGAHFGISDGVLRVLRGEAFEVVAASA